MALRDISNVTKALMNLIDRSFTIPGNWPPALTHDVWPEPPVRAKRNGIGMFLYHMVENPHYKNLPAPGRDVPPVRFTSLALTLYYQLSAYYDGDEPDSQNGLIEQQMMAVAMKALHDYPEIVDDTFVEGATDPSPIFPLDIIGHGNRFKIVYQPIQPQESISYWSTGDTRLTLSAYYEVNVALLEPETTRTLTGRVMDFNAFTFLNGNPKVLNTANEVSFVSPVDHKPRKLILQPAQIPAAPAGPLADATPYLLLLKGLDFYGSISLRLTNANWTESATTDISWEPENTASDYTAIVRETAVVESTLAVVKILPGIYGAQLVSKSVKNKPDGTSWPIELTSNVCPFAIVPRIDGITVPVLITDLITITGYLFSEVVGFRELIQLDVYIGSTRLAKVAGPPAAGEYSITSPTTIDFRYPASVAAGETMPIRIFANSAESSPRWITAP